MLRSRDERCHAACVEKDNAVDVAGEEWMDNITAGVYDDMRIWANKIHRAEPVFCEADTLLVEFRRWAKQFYSPDQLAKPTPAS